MKVKRMGITEILRKIWLFSENKIKGLKIFFVSGMYMILANIKIEN